MGNMFACSSDGHCYEDFWDLSIRDFEPSLVVKDIFTLIKENSIKVSTNQHYNTDNFKFEDLHSETKAFIERYLVSKNRNFLKIYHKYWTERIILTNEKNLTFEICATFLLLAKRNVLDFIAAYNTLSTAVEQHKMPEEVVEEIIDNKEEDSTKQREQEGQELNNLVNIIDQENKEEVFTQKNKINQLLKIYFEIMTNSVIDHLDSAEVINSCNVKGDKLIYSKQAIDKFAFSFVMSEPDNLNIRDFFKRNYHKLVDGEHIRGGLKEMSKKIEEGDLVFNINHL